MMWELRSQEYAYAVSRLSRTTRLGVCHHAHDPPTGMAPATMVPSVLTYAMCRVWSHGVVQPAGYALKLIGALLVVCRFCRVKKPLPAWAVGGAMVSTATVTAASTT